METYFSIPSIDIELEIFSLDGKHFSYEDSWLLQIYIIGLVVALLALGSTVKGLIKDFRHSFNFWDEWDQSPLLLILLAVSSLFSSIALKIIHLAIYSQNGEGVVVLDIFSIIGDMASQTITALVIMLLAYGWTIKHAKAEDM